MATKFIISDIEWDATPEQCKENRLPDRLSIKVTDIENPYNPTDNDYQRIEESIANKFGFCVKDYSL